MSAWLAVAPAAIDMGGSGAYEFMTTTTGGDLSSPPVETSYKRKRRIHIFEYRGMTLACAQTLCVESVYSNGTKSWELIPIEAGGFNVRITYDYFIGDWEEGDSPFSE